MKNNYWYSCLYPSFLSTLSSCTLASFTDQEIQGELSNLAIRAIAKFKFPKIELKYEYDTEYIDDSQEEKVEKGYFFINDVTDKEINVLLAWMKVYWLEYQLSQEKNFKNSFYDKDVTAFSSGNLISNIEKTYRVFWEYAIREENDYGRVNTQGKPAVGDINVDI